VPITGISMSRLTPEFRELYAKLEVPKADWGKPSGEVIAFAHALVVPAGKHVNTALRLRKFQIEWIRAVYNRLDENTGGRIVKQAVLSVARRNGKTLLAAVILLAHLAGPFKRPNATIVSAATTRKQAGIVFRFVKDMIRVNPFLGKALKVIDSTKRVVHRLDGSTYEAIAAEAGGQFGMGLALCVYDELAQAKNRDLYDALMTSLGSETDPLMMIISTQAPTDQHLLSELIDYGERVNQGVIFDPSFVCHLHTVPMEARIDDESQWKKANPGLGDYRDHRELRDAVKRAIEMPSQESTVRVYYLNQRVRAEMPYLTPGVYEKNQEPVDVSVFSDGRPVYGGLDLSARTDLTALVLAAQCDDGDVALLPFAWTPQDTIEARTHRDRAPYDAWERSGALLTSPGSTVDYDFVAYQTAELCSRMNIVRINYDRWRIHILKQAFMRIGAALPLVECGQGYKDISPCVEAFEELALAGKIRHGGHPVMRWCFSNAVIGKDPAGNRKLDKSKAYGRIDIAVAAVMAVGAMKASGAVDFDVAAMIA
jgi:phage terminase large subunit-like protein